MWTAPLLPILTALLTTVGSAARAPWGLLHRGYCCLPPSPGIGRIARRRAGREHGYLYSPLRVCPQGQEPVTQLPASVQELGWRQLWKVIAFSWLANKRKVTVTRTVGALLTQERSRQQSVASTHAADGVFPSALASNANTFASLFCRV